jgi:hypothetical protein
MSSKFPSENGCASSWHVWRRVDPSKQAYQISHLFLPADVQEETEKESANVPFILGINYFSI